MKTPGTAAVPAAAGESSRGPLGDGVAVTVWVTLAALTLARAVFAFVPGAWGWSLALQRFVHPVTGWLPWLVAALALLPAVARPLLVPIARAGDLVGERPGMAATAWALVLATLVLLLPDRVWFVGDFLLRQGTVELSEAYAVMFPQALPLDVLLHVQLPLLLRGAFGMDANAAARLIGGMEAALLGVVACAFARVLGLRGAPAWVAVSIVSLGGYLAMFTGFGKAFAELSVLVAATGVLAMRVARDGQGALTLGVVVAMGVILHRAGLGLVPAAVAAWAIGLRNGRWKRPGALAGIGCMAAVLALMTPRIMGIVARWDRAHFMPAADAAGAASIRLVDLANVVVVLVPLALVAVATLMMVRASAARGAGREATALVALAVPFAVGAALLHPTQGEFRDTDAFAATGVAIALLVAFLMGRLLAQRPRVMWLAPAMVLATVVPTFQWLVVNADLDRGLARVRTFVIEPPRRSDAVVARTWDFLGNRLLRLERWDDAAAAYAAAAQLAPSPRALMAWALAESRRGRFAEAQGLYRIVADQNPGNAFAWGELARASLQVGDLDQARRAIARLEDLRPGNAAVYRLRLELTRRDSLAAPR